MQLVLQLHQIFLSYMESVMISDDISLNLSSEPITTNVFEYNKLQLAIIFGILLIGVILLLFLFYRYKTNKSRLTQVFKKDEPSRNATLTQVNNEPDGLIDIHPTPTCICNLSGFIKYSNISFNLVFGESPKKLNGLILFNLLPSYLNEVLALDFNLINNGRTSGITTQGFLNHRTKNRYQIRWYLLPEKVAGENELMVTLEKTQEVEFINQSLDEPISLLRQVLDNSPVAIYIEDYNGFILEANNAACRLQQFDREELIGKCVTELNPISYHKEIIERQKKMTHLDTFSFKGVSFTKSGKPIPVEIFVNRTNFFGTPALFFLVHDLTDFIETKKQLEEYKIKAEESDRLKSSFLANLSHEVRTPMNSIMGFAELLAEPTVSNDERQSFINFIRQSGKELLSQINNMIDFSKIEAGLINLKIEICQFNLLFNKLRELGSASREMNKGVRLFFDLPQEMHRTAIATDFSRLQQILEILFRNSIKYTKNGVIEIGVKIKAPQLYEFYVRDTGIGIPQEKHRQIFEKFRQIDDTNSREFSGMGLGLSVASRLIQFLGGHQWVTSEPGKGSEFRCVLPDLLQPQNSTFLQVSCGPSTVINKIMVISPTEEIYNELIQNSKPINYQVFWAQNALEMKSMMLSNNFIYLLIAIDQLPFWQELLPKIKSVETNAQLIGISEKMDIRRAERLISMGLNDAVQSPINISTLINLLNKNYLTPVQMLTSNINQN